MVMAFNLVNCTDLIGAAINEVALLMIASAIIVAHDEKVIFSNTAALDADALCKS